MYNRLSTSFIHLQWTKQISPCLGAINPVCTVREIRHKSPRKNVFWRLSGQVDPSVEKWRMQIFGDPHGPGGAYTTLFKQLSCRNCRDL